MIYSFQRHFRNRSFELCQPSLFLNQSSWQDGLRGGQQVFYDNRARLSQRPRDPFPIMGGGSIPYNRRIACLDAVNVAICFACLDIDSTVEMISVVSKVVANLPSKRQRQAPVKQSPRPLRSSTTKT